VRFSRGETHELLGAIPTRKRKLGIPPVRCERENPPHTVHVAGGEVPT
jgi:hypothetical protein